MSKAKITGATIPYHLRPHKAIERNLFIALLKILDGSSQIDLKKYKYVGFGAAFLEDFKLFHIELGITDMDCIEIDFSAYSRQCFNNPYHFLNIYNKKSTDYITEFTFKSDTNQIIWLDYAAPKDLRQQLVDLELIAEKLSALDILKFTFNAQIGSFIDSNQVGCAVTDANSVKEFLKNDPTYQLYIPENITNRDILKNFSGVVRAMGIRAINRGLAKANKNLTFNHLSAFLYADGQTMTTICGLITGQTDFCKIMEQTKIETWEFYQSSPIGTEFIDAHHIAVPAMTVLERIEIDKKIPASNISDMAKSLDFLYGTTQNEHVTLIEGYYKYYKYLPYYSKVIY